jgi:serine O-acetyltransferase
MSPIRLWLLSNALWRSGFRRLALSVKWLNSLIYRNSLSPSASINPQISFGHHGFGTIIEGDVVLGRRVSIWQNVTIAVRGPVDSSRRVIVEDDVLIGAGAVIVPPDDASLRIGRGARIGARAVVVDDVPPGASVVSAAPVVVAGGQPAAERARSESRG